MGHLSCLKKLRKSKNGLNHKSSDDDERKRRGIGCYLCGDSFLKHEGDSTKKNYVKKGNQLGCSWRCTCFLTPEIKRISCCWKKKDKKAKDGNAASKSTTMHLKPDISTEKPMGEEIIRIGNVNIAARVFTYKELAKSTQIFSSECLLGEGRFGKVYKGKLEDTNEVVAVKKLDGSVCKESCRDFLLEVLMLSLLSHPNLVNLIGYCAEGSQRLLVCDYLPLGSLQDHLLDISPDRKPLDWNTRMKIALGMAKGLEHLHDTASPPVIFRDLKSSNVLLDDDCNPRLVDFGFEKFGLVTGTYGYCAPEYILSGKLTVMSDIYSFGVVLLELFTGRKAVDPTRPLDEQRLVDWAMPRFKDKKHLVRMADPLLQGNFPVKSLHQALAIAAMCVQEEDTTRPLIKDMVRALQAIAGHDVENDDGSLTNNPQHMTRNSCYFTDYGSVKSFCSDWKSCSTERDGEDDINEEELTVAS